MTGLLAVGHRRLRRYHHAVLPTFLVIGALFAGPLPAAEQLLPGDARNAQKLYRLHCIGCHAISNDGRYMALTLGGSSTYNGANFSLLDIRMQNLVQLSTSTSTGTSPTNNPTEYWKQFRMESFATETAWGPNPADTSTPYNVVNMYKSKLYQSTISVSGTTRTTSPLTNRWPR